jgi:FdhD protein
MDVVIKEPGHDDPIFGQLFMAPGTNLSGRRGSKMIKDADTMSLPQSIAPDIPGQKYVDRKWEQIPLSVPKEMAFTIYINNQELVTILCTPFKLNCLVLGYLLAEGIIADTKDVASMRVCEDDALADVKLNRSDFVLPQKRILTSGCGGGVSLNVDMDAAKIKTDIHVAPKQLLQLMRYMLENTKLYNLTGGVHTSALCDDKDVIVVGEDIGRHNTLDKIVGECFLRKISTKNKILLTSGRVSSEMALKVAKMQVPVIASLTSPTQRAVTLARDLDITLAGYVRRTHFTVYTRPDRLGAGAG